MQDNNPLTIHLKNSSSPTPPVFRPRRKFRKNRLVAFVVAVVLLAGLVGAGVYFYLRTTPSIPSTNATDTNQTVEKVGKLMLLPQETPTIAVVSDLNKLKDQKFFAHAERGDVVLMYAHEQKAILYSPSQNKIIEVAPITNDTK